MEDNNFIFLPCLYEQADLRQICFTLITSPRPEYLMIDRDFEKLPRVNINNNNCEDSHKLQARH